MPFQIPVRNEDVQPIAQMPDAIVRNLWITQAYHDLGARMSAHLGGEGTWLSFGVWASKTAGVDMRSDELPSVVRDAYEDAHRLREALDQANKASRLHRLGIVRFHEEETLLGIFENAISEVSAELGKGNGMVYAELAPVYANMIAKFDAGEVLQGPELEAFIDAQVIEGSPDNTENFKEAIRSYFRAMRSDDRVERAQLVCHANLLAGLHEQKRLQGPIEGALSAPVVEGLGRIRHVWFVRSALRIPVLRRLVRALDAGFRALAPEVENLFEVIATKTMMELRTWDGTLQLDEDLPPPPDGPLFPPDLVDVKVTGLRDVLGQWDASDPPGVGMGATNWSRLEDRMTYICSLFRSHQQTPGLLEEPFSQQQRRDLAAGKMPDGPL